jgi:hypothetical protein
MSGVDPVLVEEVDVVGAEPTQRLVADPGRVGRAAVDATVGEVVALEGEAELGCDLDLVAAPGDGAADQFLVDERAVDLGGVEQGDAELDRPVEDSSSVVVSRRAARSEVRQDQRAVLGEREARVVGDLPEMPVEVGEVTGVAAVEGLAGGSGDRRPGRGGRVHHRVDLGRGPHVLRQRDAAETVGGTIGARVLDARVGGELLPSPEDDGRAAGLDEDGLLDFLAPPTERLVEAARRRQVVGRRG